MSVIDLKIFNNLRDAMGADFIGELIDTFLEDAPNQIAQMTHALAEKDAESFRRAAHTIKSNAATFGAAELSALARELEMMGRDKNLEVGSRFEVMKEAFEKARRQLSELR
ncbi:MAG: Hpt domain-containing protein [Chloroflexi bacterium]|nr:Hpt domain-containing protein [Chloroflexota bacterium]